MKVFLFLLVIFALCAQVTVADFGDDIQSGIGKGISGAKGVLSTVGSGVGRGASTLAEQGENKSKTKDASKDAAKTSLASYGQDASSAGGGDSNPDSLDNAASMVSVKENLPMYFLTAAGVVGAGALFL